MRRKQVKRDPMDFRPLDVVYVFGTDNPGIITGVVVDVNNAENLVNVTLKGTTSPVWFSKHQLKRIAGRGGPK